MKICYTILPSDRTTALGLNSTIKQAGDIVFRTEKAAKKFFLDQKINKNRFSIFEIETDWMENTIPGEYYNILINNAVIVRKLTR